jgi:hypothetical protein
MPVRALLRRGRWPARLLDGRDKERRRMANTRWQLACRLETAGKDPNLEACALVGSTKEIPMSL